MEEARQLARQLDASLAELTGTTKQLRACQDEVQQLEGRLHHLRTQETQVIALV